MEFIYDAGQRHHVANLKELRKKTTPCYVVPKIVVQRYIFGPRNREAKKIPCLMTPIVPPSIFDLTN